MRDPKERLRDILDAIAAIERYRDRDRAAFDRDELLQVRKPSRPGVNRNGKS